MLAGNMQARNPHTHTALPAVLQKLRSAASVSFEQAHPIPPEVNHSLAFHEHEQQTVFQQEWNCVGRYDMSGYQSVLRETMEWDANWKNLIENFIESYHVPVAHGKTFALHKKAPEDYVCGEDDDHYCYHRAAQAATSGLGAAHPANQRLQGEWRRMMVDFCVFPNHLVMAGGAVG